MADVILGGGIEVIVEAPTVPVITMEPPTSPEVVVVPVAGLPGADGESAFELAEDEGFVGDITAWLASLRGPKGDPGTTTWAGITDKPTTFTPAAHTHAESEITGLTADLASKAPLADMTTALTYLNGLTGAQGTAIATLGTTKAPLASPAFTGTPTGITKAHVSLGNVDNTADTAKPISTAQQTALNLLAPLASPSFTGVAAFVSLSTNTNLFAGGSYRSNASVRTSGVTLTINSPELQFCDTTTTAFTMVLPTTTSAGYKYTLKKVDASANALTIAGVIDGATNYVITTRWKWITVVSTGTSNNYYIVAVG